MRRTATTAVLALVSFVLLAGPVWATEGNDNGEGLLGETDDRIITFFSFGVILFFALVAILGSAIQVALDRRKQRRKAAHLRARSGW